MNKENLSRNGVLRVTGAVISIFSLTLGLLITFVSASSCSFVSAFALLVLFLLFIAGVTTFLIAQLLTWREHRLRPTGS